MNELKKLTKELLDITNNANDIYMKKREAQIKGDFFSEVKPFADHAKAVSDKWKELSLTWLRETSGKRYIHPMQIQATVENLELVCVQAFFPETSFKRFKSYIQSISYVLKEMMYELENAENKKARGKED
ncbi:MAG TPA: YppE family protein [Chondromyces sp.]|nr:YppE family protein [Chondromyces sp.]